MSSNTDVVASLDSISFSIQPSYQPPDAARIREIVETLENTWPEDQAKRADPAQSTLQFHSSVPVLKYLDWKLTQTGRGFAESVLPLNVTSTNQHITHQAAVILIAADYTGGVALATLLHDVPLVGIQPQKTDYAAYLWGAKADITWITPSKDDLVCTAKIPKESHERIVKRFFSGRRVLETVRIDMTNAGNLVAVANLTYWVQDTYALRKNAFDEKRVHPLYDHRHKTSARLIAGLRALEQENKPPLFEDKFAAELAGKHGIILAQRFRSVAPPLQEMIATRTKHLDDLVNSFHEDKPCQIVNIGAGLDTRMYRVSLPDGSKIFDADLPLMLTQRRKSIPLLIETRVKRIEVPIDLREQAIDKTLQAIPSFDEHAPTLFIWEGGSMYFEKTLSMSILRSLSQIMTNRKSVAWMDYTDESVVDGTSTIPTVIAFIDAMRCLGEPFIAGYSDIKMSMAQCGMDVVEDVASNHYSKSDDDVFGLYRFCVVKRSS